MGCGEEGDEHKEHACVLCLYLIAGEDDIPPEHEPCLVCQEGHCQFVRG